MPLGPPPLTVMWFVLLGTNVSFSSAVVSNIPTLLDPKAATYSVLPLLLTAIPTGVARLLSLTPAGLGAGLESMCWCRCRAVALPPDRMVTRASCRWPRTVLPPPPGPSKRTSLCASVFETYTLPLIGFTAMLNRTVPTPLKNALSTGGLAVASMAKTSLSGRLNLTALSQMRPQVLDGQSPSCVHTRPRLEPDWQARRTKLVRLYLTISPVSGPGIGSDKSWFGYGRPPG